jgi:hypothetical protein
LRLAARELEQRLNRDHSDHAGSDLPCACGRRARYAGRRAKGFQTVLGLVTLERAYYHCAACGQGFCPRDRALGLTASMLSPGVTRMVGQVAARVSFAESSALLQELAGLSVEAKHVERAAEALGREVADDERGVVVPPPAPSAPTLYLGVDGTAVPMRAAELEGRAGKQPDGTAKTREAKLCTVWSAEARAPDGQPQRDPGSVTYSGAIESAATRDTDLEPSEFAAAWSWAMARCGSGISPTSSSPAPSRSSTAATPSRSSTPSPRRSMGRPPSSATRGHKTARTNSMPATSMPSSAPWPPTRPFTRKPVSAGPMSSATAPA